VLGLGAGWNVPEFRAFGLPFDHHVSRFEEAFEIVRRLLDGERVTFHGRFHDAEDALLLPSPARRPKLMIGANAPRMLSIALPHVEVWNTWFTHYGNSVGGFARHNADIDAAAERAGRDPSVIERSACVFVALEGAGARQNDAGAPAVPVRALENHLARMADAGADEVILVADPITEASIRSLGTMIPSA
jgi:alkanesulfonate monooxygenase SsuD/methylene tetrahydromethanopterin reductase-like flavin-dependent oxidoreductase (luciferase family)